jgi:hypothetical protein
VLDADSQDLLQMPATHDEQPVQALGPHRLDPALGEGVGVGRLHRREHHLGTLRPEHVVEPAAELRVTIANNKAHAASFLQHEQQVAGLLGDPGGVGLAVTPARCTRRVSSSTKNRTYNCRSQVVSTVKKAQATIPAACWRRNARQVVAARRGAGSSPWRRRVVRIAVAETCAPSCCSSPLMR